MKTRAGIVLVMFLFAMGMIDAQDSPPMPPPEARQFDFWIGEWTVTNAAGAVAGTNRIESVANGFALLENWQGVRGGSGKSLNTWNAGKRCWQQYWVGNDGLVLELSGRLVGTKMVLSGAALGGDGTTTLHRISWTPNADGTVRQLWETSSDRGSTWKSVFDGLYRKTSAATGNAATR